LERAFVSANTDWIQSPVWSSDQRTPVDERRLTTTRHFIVW
jgi:hypothetical protein